MHTWTFRGTDLLDFLEELRHRLSTLQTLNRNKQILAVSAADSSTIQAAAATVAATVASTVHKPPIQQPSP